jgi:hypothetical protein
MIVICIRHRYSISFWCHDEVDVEKAEFLRALSDERLEMVGGGCQGRCRSHTSVREQYQERDLPCHMTNFNNRAHWKAKTLHAKHFQRLSMVCVIFWGSHHPSTEQPHSALLNFGDSYVNTSKPQVHKWDPLCVWPGRFRRALYSGINEEKHKLVHTINRSLDRESNPWPLAYGNTASIKGTTNANHYAKSPSTK